jgi:hypothetical protein
MTDDKVEKSNLIYNFINIFLAVADNAEVK